MQGRVGEPASQHWISTVKFYAGSLWRVVSVSGMLAIDNNRLLLPRAQVEESGANDRGEAGGAH